MGTEPRSADGEDTPENGMQPTIGEPMLDRSGTNPECRELLPRHDTMLAVGEVRDRYIRASSSFWSYVVEKVGGIDCSESRAAANAQAVEDL